MPVITWLFQGPHGPALDPIWDEGVPNLIGGVMVPGLTQNEAELAWRFYVDQGLTATDLVQMTSADVLMRTPVLTVRARAERPAGSNVGTVASLTGPARSLTSAPVPVETPP